MLEQIDIAFKTPPKRHFFFGYYDVSPLSMDGTKLLAQEVNFIDRMPCEDDRLIIGYFDLKSKKWIPLSETSAWNWQMGCRLQWLGPDFNRFVIYNDREDGKFVSYIVDVQTGEKIKLPFPIYSISSDGRYSVTLNFARLHHTRPGYGYWGGEDPYFHEEHPDNDGIFLVNLKTGECKLIISIDRLYRIKHMPIMDEGIHWVNHLIFNRKGTRFIFLHRWSLPDGGMYSRLYTANYEGSELSLLLDTGMASHFCWRDNETIICWGRQGTVMSSVRNKSLFINRFIKFLRPLYHKLLPRTVKHGITKDAYLIIKDFSGIVSSLNHPALKENGHCSVSPDGRWMLTDTYPDKEHFRRLLLYNLLDGRLLELGRFKSLPPGFPEDWDISGARCDLHPKWSFDGKCICIDSVHEDYRGMYLFDVKMLIQGV